MTRDKILAQIEALRAKNNKLWMGYVKLAFKYAPKEASALHVMVRRIDEKISKLGKMLEEK